MPRAYKPTKREREAAAAGGKISPRAANWAKQKAQRDTFKGLSVRQRIALSAIGQPKVAGLGYRSNKKGELEAYLVTATGRHRIPSSEAERKKVRAWLKSQGVNIPEKGRYVRM